MLNSILIITAVVFLFYIKTLKFSYCIDDVAVAGTSDPKRHFKNIFLEIWCTWKGDYYRSDKPFLPHLICFFLHWTNCLLVYFVFGHNSVSLLTALLFAVNPAGGQGSVWLSGKGYLTATTCILLMYAFKLAAPLFYWLSFPWSFSAAFAPVIFLFTPWWYLILLIPFMAVFKWRYCYKIIKDKTDITPKRTKKFTLRRIILYFKTLGYYFCLGVLPVRLGVYHNYLYSYGLTEEETRTWEKLDIYFFVGLGVMYVLITNLFWNYNLVIFGLFWFVALISQWCNFPVTIQQAIAERYIYLPLAGLMFFISSMIMELPDPWRGYAFVAFFVYYAGRMIIHTESFRNIYFQVDHNLLNFPYCYAVWTWKGQVERARGAYFTALEAWFNGWKLRKHDFRLCNNIAVLLANIGQFKEAEDFLILAGQNLPEDIKDQAKKHIDGMLVDIRAARYKLTPHQTIKRPFYRDIAGLG